jgi:hypothetical protein
MILVLFPIDYGVDEFVISVCGSFETLLNLCIIGRRKEDEGIPFLLKDLVDGLLSEGHQFGLREDEEKSHKKCCFHNMILINGEDIR